MTEGAETQSTERAMPPLAKAAIAVIVFAAVMVSLGVLAGAGILVTVPIERYPSAAICPTGEVLVEETEIVTGDYARTTTRVCCADPADTRTYGRCSWSSSMPLDEAFESGAVCGLAMGAGLLGAACSTVPPFALGMAVWAVRRRRATSA